MKGDNINNLGKVEKNKNVMSGDCIFPFKYKKNTHDKCLDTDKGPICATSVSERGTLKTYGYCKTSETLKKSSSHHSSAKKTIKITTPNKETKNISKNKSTNNIMEEVTEIKTTNKRLNELFTNALSKLNDIFMRKGEPFRARAYKKAEETILLQPQDIMDYTELKGLSNIGDTILSKLKELQETGTLKLLQRMENDPLQLFTQIHGIGPKKAEALISKDIKNIEQLKENTELLNDNQKIGLKYFEDINKRIPREIIDQYKNIFEKSIQEIGDENIQFDIVGSYRRGVKSSGDIDIILSHKLDDETTFLKILNKLKEQNIIIEFLTKGKIKSLTITKIENDIPRRVDFLYTPQAEYSFAVLYFTGSKGFNTVMRHRALQFGYSLNEHGIYKMDGKKKGAKVIEMDFPTEKSIFDFLKMEYKEPSERKDGRAVTSTSGTPIINKPIKMIKKTIRKEKNPKSNNKSNNKTIKQKKTKSTFIDKFREDGIKYLNKLTEEELVKIIKHLNDTYYNNDIETITTDNEYDIIKEYVERTYPANKDIKEVGAPVVNRNKVKLPYFMGSMDKIKPDTDAVIKWKDKYTGPYVISAKLDGVSGLYSTENGEKKLYTRGNGTIGQDISYFIPYLKLPQDENITIRGEFIINRHIFDDKYKDKFSNPRNFVSGIINAKNIDIDKFGDIEFVAYEVIKPEITPQEQMKFLDKINVTNVLYEIHDEISNEKLSDILVNWRKTYKFESDGIIVTDDKKHLRVDKNPEHSFAFKMVLSEQIAEAKVIDVIWNVSKDGLLKPKIQIEPIVLGGAKIQYATAHNAATVVSNKLGIGAIVKIIRSGDVIPYIMETVVPAETIKMPDVEYVWNKTNVDIELTNKTNNKDIIHKTITYFFTGLNVDSLSKGNVTKIINTGYNSIPKILQMSKDDFMKVEGFKEKLATKIHDSIREKLNDASLELIMSSSNIFGQGFGDKKIKLILKEYPDIMTSSEERNIKIEKLSNVKGMANKTAVNFIDKIPLMIQFLEDTKLKHKLAKKIEVPTSITQDTSHPLYNKSIVFTGVRDKSLMELLEKVYSVSLSSSVSKNTFALIAKSKDDDSSKLEKARKLNIPIYDLNEFKTLYKFT